MIKLFGLDRKSQFEMNNYSFFYLLISNIVKNMSKMSQNAHYLTVHIQHYLTLKKALVLYAKQIGWPV